MVARAFIICAFSLLTPCVIYTKPLLVRVNLGKFSLDQKTSSYIIECPNGFVIAIPGTADQRLRFRAPKLMVSLNKQGFCVYSSPKKKFYYRGTRITITPRDKHFTLNHQTFAGKLSLVKKDNNQSVFLINTVPIDEYLYAVLPYEIFQSWPHEVQKVQALASRTYAIHHMMHARAHGLPYDVQCTNLHQNYKGHHEHEHVHDAIKETRDLIVTYHGRPALTMFDACCGGITTARIKNPLIKYHPYLGRKAACRFCASCSLARWTRELSLKQLQENLARDPVHGKKITAIGTLCTVRAYQKDHAGLVHTILLRGTKNQLVMPVSRFNKYAGPKVWSSCVTFEQMPHAHKPPRIKINGRGFGHQIGLCQHGARELVKRGWDFKRILAFYYPGTKITRYLHGKL